MKTGLRNGILMAVALLCFSPACSRAATFGLNPTADAFLTTGSTGSLSTDNYGAAGALSLAAPGLAQGEFQSVMQVGFSAAKNSFDAQFGAGQWSVQSVTLQLTAATPNNALFNPSAAGDFGVSLMQNNGWIEGSGTPAAPGSTGISFSTVSNFVGSADEMLGTFAFNGATNGTATYALKLSSSLAADILSGGTASLRLFAADSLVSYLFDSRNFGTASARPLLTVTVVPEPSFFALGALGLGWLAYRRVRLKHRRG